MNTQEFDFALSVVNELIVRSGMEDVSQEQANLLDEAETVVYRGAVVKSAAKLEILADTGNSISFAQEFKKLGELAAVVGLDEILEGRIHAAFAKLLENTSPEAK